MFLYDLPEYGKLRQNLLQTAFDRALRHAPRSVSERKFGARVAVFHDRVVFAAHAAVFAGEVYQALGVIPFKKAAKTAFGRLLFHKKLLLPHIVVKLLYTPKWGKSSKILRSVVFFIYGYISRTIERTANGSQFIADRTCKNIRSKSKDNK